LYAHDEWSYELNELRENTRRTRQWNGVFQEEVGLLFRLQERGCVPNFNMTWSYDTTEGQHLERLASMPFAVEVGPDVVKRHLIASAMVALMIQIREVRHQTHKMLLNSPSTFFGRLHRWQRTSKLESSDALAFSRMS
jgi:hypothetical protein